MSTYLALDPVSVAIMTALNVVALTTLAPGGVHAQLPPAPVYPCVLFEVAEPVQEGGFGTRDGLKHFPRVGLRVTVFTAYAGFVQAHQVMAKVHELLATAPAVTGYSSWAIFRRETLPVPDSVVAGVRVTELVSNFDLFAEAA